MGELEDLAKVIENGKAKRILVLCGAGVSTGECFYVGYPFWFVVIRRNRKHNITKLTVLFRKSPICSLLLLNNNIV